MVGEVGGGTGRRGMGKPGGQTTITVPIIPKGHRCMCVCVLGKSKSPEAPEHGARRWDHNQAGSIHG